MKRKYTSSIDVLLDAHASLARAHRAADRQPIDTRRLAGMCTLGFTLTSEPQSMPAKKDRGRPNVLTDLSAHMQATRAAREWAEKSVIYRAAGKTREANAAEKQAKRHLAKAMEIESTHAALRRMPTVIKPRRR
jgi:hypothetical protein